MTSDDSCRINECDMDGGDCDLGQICFDGGTCSMMYHFWLVDVLIQFLID